MDRNIRSLRSGSQWQDAVTVQSAERLRPRGKSPELGNGQRQIVSVSGLFYRKVFWIPERRLKS